MLTFKRKFLCKTCICAYVKNYSLIILVVGLDRGNRGEVLSVGMKMVVGLLCIFSKLPLMY